MPRKLPIAGSDKERPLKSEADTQRYTPTPRRNPRAAPSIGMFEAPYRCLRINLEWWSHISGMIDALSSEELWLGDEEEQARALREIAALLAYNQCGGDELTPQEYEDAFANGMYRALNDLAAQVKSGVKGGFSVDADGTTTFPTTGETPIDLPVDDPLTPYDDSLAAKMGGTIAVSRALELLYDKIDAYYGVTNGTPTTILSTAQTLMKAFFPCDGAMMDTAIASYYTYRGSNARILFDITATIQNYLFCRGGGERAWGQWLSDQSGFAIAKFTVMNDLSTALSDEFWSNYFAQGAALPSTQYLNASCVKIPTQTLTGLVFAVQRSTTIIKPLHRFLWKVKGYALDVDGDIQDWFWFRTAAGVNTFTTPTVVHSSFTNLPSSTQVPYSSTHEYQYTTDCDNLANNPFLVTMNKHANMNATGLTYPVPFEFTLEDLGEYGI